MPSVVANFVGRFIPLSFLSSPIYDTLAEEPINLPNGPSPPAPWLESKKDESGQKLPQSIAHRGYKARYPENTMFAFESAVVDAGADGLETDIHLTKDEVVVLSHDSTLKRCFGRDDRIVDIDYSQLRNLRTLRSPNLPMPRLDELLRFLAEDVPGRQEIWLLLDIKMDNDPETVMRRIGETISSVPPHPQRPWSARVVMGIWAQKYLPLCERFAPDFPIALISFSTSYAQRLLKPVYSNIGFNILTQSLYLDPKFIKRACTAKRPILAWTVNKEEWMRWCISAGLDAVITDDPARFNEVKRQWTTGRTEHRISVKLRLQTLWLRFMIYVMNSVLAWKSSRKQR